MPAVAYDRREPGNAVATHYLGLAAWQRGDLALAEARMREAIATKASIPDFHNNLGLLLRDTRRVEYAYPVYDRDYGKNTKIIRAYFATLGIDQLGRFAEFDYINSDECIRRALVLADKINAQPEQSLAG